jgi:hypothetical protein
MKVFKKVTAIAAALALLGGGGCYAGKWTNLTPSDFRFSTTSCSIISTLALIGISDTYPTILNTFTRINHPRGTLLAIVTRICSQIGPQPHTLNDPSISFSDDIIPLSSSELSHLDPDLALENQLIHLLIDSTSSLYSVLKDSLLLRCITNPTTDPEFESLTWLDLLEEVNANGAAQSLALQTQIANTEAALQKLLAPPWQPQQLQFVAQPLQDNAVIGRYTAIMLGLCAPGELGIPPNRKLQFGYSPNGTELKHLGPIAQGNYTILPIPWLKDANEYGYVFVDVDGNDPKNPIRPFTIRERIPECVLQQIQNARAHLALH